MFFTHLANRMISHRTEETSRPEDLQVEFISHIQDLYKSGIFSDLKLIVGSNTEFFVHRNILGVRSEYFSKLFNSTMNDSKSTVLSFPDHPPEYFRILLDFYYSIKLEIDSASAFGVLKLSDEFQVPKLREHCVDIVKKSIDDGNYYEILEISLANNYHELVEYCLPIFETNPKKMTEMVEFLKIEKSTLKFLLESDFIKFSELESI